MPRCELNCKSEGPPGPIWCMACGHDPKCCTCVDEEYPDPYHVPYPDPFAQLVKELEMSDIPIRPRGNVVVLKPFPPEEFTEGGLALPQIHQRKLQKGTVLAIGDGEYNAMCDKLIPVRDLKVGDVAHWSESGGALVKVKGQEFWVVPASSLIFVEV